MSVFSNLSIVCIVICKDISFAHGKVGSAGEMELEVWRQKSERSEARADTSLSFSAAIM